MRFPFCKSLHCQDSTCPFQDFFSPVPPNIFFRVSSLRVPRPLDVFFHIWNTSCLSIHHCKKDLLVVLPNLSKSAFDKREFAQSQRNDHLGVWTSFILRLHPAVLTQPLRLKTICFVYHLFFTHNFITIANDTFDFTRHNEKLNKVPLKSQYCLLMEGPTLIPAVILPITKLGSR